MNGLWLRGLKAAAQLAEGGAPPANVAGSPVGLLLTITKPGAPTTAGQPVGILLTVTKAN